jgi:hypothetical protein
LLGQGSVDVQHERVGVGAKLDDDERHRMGHPAADTRHVTRQAARLDGESAVVLRPPVGYVSPVRRIRNRSCDAAASRSRLPGYRHWVDSGLQFRDRSNLASMIPGPVSHYGPTACY